MVKIRFSNPWTDPETGQRYPVNSTAMVAADVARTLVAYGYATYVTGGEEPAGTWVTPELLDDRLGEVVEWGAALTQTNRWFVRVAATAGIGAGQVPVRVTGTGIPVPAGVPASTVQVLLPEAVAAAVTVQVTYQVGNDPAVQLATVTVPEGRTAAARAVAVVVPGDAVLHADVVTAPVDPVAGVTVLLVAVGTLGVLATDTLPPPAGVLARAGGPAGAVVAPGMFG